MTFTVGTNSPPAQKTFFPRRIAALEDDNDAQPCVLHPFLELAEFDLKFAHFLFVFLAGDFRVLGSHLRVVCSAWG